MKTLVLGVFAASAVLISGCFTSGDNVSPSTQESKLSINVGVQDVDKGGALSKGATITFKKLVITLISNATVPDTLQDTLFANDSIGSKFKTNATDSQSVSLSYNIKPLRNWVVSVKTLDLNDSVIHSASDTADSVKIGENRSVVLELRSKFIMYIAKFTLPDSLKATGTSQKQVLKINRLMMVVDGDTVVDSSKTSGYFSAGTPSHVIRFDYIKTGTSHDVELYVFGDLDNWPADKPLFADTLSVGGDQDSTYARTLPWTGPGSPNDPNYNPSNPGGATGDLKINIGKVGSIVIDSDVDDSPFGKRSGK